MSPEARAPYPWIVQPVVDLLFVCGGLPLLLIAFNVWALGWTLPSNMGSTVQRALLVPLLIGQHLFADAHNAATHLRLWGSKEDRSRFAFYRVWLMLACVPLFLSGLIVPGATSIFVYLYLVAVFWHYAAQACGVSLIYCAKRGYRLSPSEKRVYRGFFLSLSAMTIVRFVSFRNVSPEIWFGIPMPFWGPVPRVVYHAAVACFALFATLTVAVVVRKAAGERKLLPFPSALIVATTVWLGASDGAANSLLWLYVPAFFHGSQYLAVCLAYARQERGLERAVPFSRIRSLIISTHAIQFSAAAIVGGAVLYVAIPYSLAACGLEPAIVAGLVLAVVNFHHFITDAAIWHLSDPRCRKVLLS